MRQKIIVGYEDSPEGRDALALGGLLGSLADCSLLLATCYGHDPLGDDRGGRSAVADAESVLAGTPVADDIERRPVSGRTPAVALSLLADAENAAAIVVGSSRHATHGFTSAGGVARQLLASSPCSVAVAPRGYHTRAVTHLDRLLAAFVDTDEGNAGLWIAQSLAHAGRASLRVISVAESADERLPERRREMSAVLRRLAKTVAADGDVLIGDPVKCLLGQATTGVELIVTGSRGYGVARQVSLGSVSARLIELSPVPVLVVPRGGDRDLIASPAPRSVPATFLTGP